MSGGTWNYQDSDLRNYRIKDLTHMIKFLMDVFHEIDWAESGDKSRKDVEPKVYNLMLKLGNDLFNGD